MTTNTPTYGITSLKLYNFRCYRELSLTFPLQPIILTGPNGAGKTNILEAISLFSPGKGLRKSKLPLLANIKNATAPWAIHSTYTFPDGALDLSTGVDPKTSSDRRFVKINGAPQAQSVLHEWLHVLWQTPQSDSLFIDGMSTRRRFVDKLISQVHPSYTKHLYRYDYAQRERSRLLKEGQMDDRWLSVLEETFSQEAVAITVHRLDFTKQLTDYGQNNVTSFPSFSLQTHGLVENWIQESPALVVEEKIQKHLKENRQNDALTGGTKIGPHQSEIPVINLDYNLPAEVCSTGEQKALLLSLMLAQCRLQAFTCTMKPILLLDEVVAHLDQTRRQHLFEEIVALGVQAWLTGTDSQIFQPLVGLAHFFEINNATVKEGSL
jgi:DNA replication and repair protein RecF